MMATATSPTVIVAPAPLARRTTPSATMSSAAEVCMSSAAERSNLSRSASEARRAASPVITVTRDAKAPSPRSMRSVCP